MLKNYKKMKTVLIIITLFASTTLFAQDKYDTFIEKIGVEKQIKTFVNNYIDQLAKQSASISTDKWTTIKAGISYTAYLNEVKTIIKNNYTLAEIDAVFAANDMVSPVNTTGKFIYKPKASIRDKMYKASKTFGKNLNVQLKNLISQN